MADLAPTFAFEGDEVYALFEGEVIAHGKVANLEQVEASAVEYLDALNKERKTKKKEEDKKQATHIITPNGVKGRILGKVVQGLWSDEVSARLENGEVRTYHVTADDYEFVRENPKTAGAGIVASLRERLDADFEHDRRALASRADDLDALSREARALLSKGASAADENDLNEIVIAAEHEQREVKEALEHLVTADAESFIPSAPFEPTVVEQATVGVPDNGGRWLDNAINDMADEAKGTDFEALATEGPSLFVTELDDGALADTGTTRELAFSHIVSKTAGYEGEGVDEYRELFVARTEVARRAELAARKTTTQKEAATKQAEVESLPDEVLFS